MSWDIMIMNAEGAPADTTEESVPTSMGVASVVRDKISECLQDVDWTNPEWGHLSNDEYSIEFNFQLEGEVDSFMLHVRGGGDAVAAIGHMCKTNGWAALDLSSGDRMDFGAASNESWQRFQAYRDRVINPAQDEDAVARKDMGDLLLGLLAISKGSIADDRMLYPHGAVIDSEGKCTAVVVHDALAAPDVGRMIRMLVKGFRADAKDGRYRATGVAFKVIIKPPGSNSETDAIAMRLEHKYGFSSEVFYPYSFDSDGRPAYGKMFSHEVDPIIFQDLGPASEDSTSPLSRIINDEDEAKPASLPDPQDYPLLVMPENKGVLLDLSHMEKELRRIPGISNLHLKTVASWQEIEGQFVVGKEETTVSVAETGITISPQCDAGLQLALEIQNRVHTPLRALGGGRWFSISLQGIKTLDELKKLIDEQCK